MTAPCERGGRPVDEIDWSGGALRSTRFDDVYFSSADGLAESRAVFLAGCGLPDAWRGRNRFTVAELGFGTGLNIAALLDLWAATREPGAHLSIVSVEAFALSRQAAARALATWPELAASAGALLRDWPRGRRGFHRFDLDGFDATLDLYVGEVADALAAWSGKADAWFLDGFAPSRNPQMWSEAVLAEVGRLSAPGAAAGTFTVAGAVRRGLTAAGFEVAKRPGHGAKRERLEARRPGSPEAFPARPRRVVVVGGGIAGAALVRALTRLGAACVLVEAETPGAGASGNPAALVTPRLDAGLGPAAELHAQAFHRAVALYGRETPGAVIAEGAVQLSVAPRDAGRFARVADWRGFEPGALVAMDASAIAAALDEDATLLPDDEGADAPSALNLAEALVVDPAVILSVWLDGAERRTGRVARLATIDGRWLCLGAAGETIAEGDAVCLAAGLASADLAGLLPLRPVRGQLEYAEAEVFTGAAAAWDAYAIPLGGGGALFGASHRRGDADIAYRPDERAANLAALAQRRPRLAARIAALPDGALGSRIGVRAATADHLPLAGLARPRLAVLAGLGGRGFTLAPLLAEHVAAILLGAPSPLPVALVGRLDPTRFGTAKPSVLSAVEQ